MDLSVVIPTLDRQFLACDVFLSLKNKFPESLSVQYIVVSQKSGQPIMGPVTYIEEVVDRYNNELTLIDLAECNANLARMVAVNNASGRYLLFLDDDLQFPFHYGEMIDSLISRNVDCAVGPVFSGFRPDFDSNSEDFCSPSYKKNMLILPAGNLLIKNELFVSCGGFDLNFRGACHREDVELAYRLNRNKVNIEYYPELWVFHLMFDNGGGRAAVNSGIDDFFYNTIYCYEKIKDGGHSGKYVWNKILRPGLFCKANLLSPLRFISCLKAFFSNYLTLVILKKRNRVC